MAEHTVVCRLQSPSEISPGSDQHRRVRFLDLDLRVVYSTGSAEFAFKIYSDTGNAYAYLQFIVWVLVRETHILRLAQSLDA